METCQQECTKGFLLEQPWPWGRPDSSEPPAACPVQGGGAFSRSGSAIAAPASPRGTAVVGAGHHGEHATAVEEPMESDDVLVRCPSCRYGQNYSWWTWCKQCWGPLPSQSGEPPCRSGSSNDDLAGASPLTPGTEAGRTWRPWRGQAPPAGGGRSPSSRSRGSSSDTFSDGTAPGSDGSDEWLANRGEITSSEEQRLVALVSLLEQSGDTAGAVKYRRQLDELHRSQQESFIRVGEAAHLIHQSEAGLRRAVARLTQCEATLNEALADVEAASAEVDYHRSRHQAAVSRLATSFAAEETQDKLDEEADPALPPSCG